MNKPAAFNYADYERVCKDRDHLLRCCQRMHCWIFCHTGDEEEAYNECGLTEEDNIRFGSLGKVTYEDSNGGKPDK